LDIPKLIDLCAIFGSVNPDNLRIIVQRVFQSQPSYLQDFKAFIDDVISRIVPEKAQLVNRQRKRDEIDLSTLNADMKEKVDVVIQCYDIIKSLWQITEFFPYACIEHMFYHKKFMLCLENIYMTIRGAFKVWRIIDDTKDLLNFVLSQIYSDIFRIVTKLFKTNVEAQLGFPITKKNTKKSKDLSTNRILA